MPIAAIKARLDTALPAGSLRARMAGGAFWSLLAIVVPQAFAAVAAVLVARMLGKSVYGELGMLQSTVAMFLTFAGLTLGFVASKHVAEFRATDPARAGRILGLAIDVATASGLAVAAGVALAAGPLARRTLHAPELAPYIRLTAPLLLSGSLMGVCTGALGGFEAFRRQSARAAAAAAVTAAVTVALTWAGGLAGAVLANLITGFLTCALYFHAVLAECRHHGVRIDCRGAWAERRLLWTFALPSMLCGVMVTPFVWAGNVVLFNAPDGEGQLGLFTAASQWRAPLMILPTVLSNPLLPMLVQLYAGREFGRLRRLLFRVLGLNVMTVGAIALVLAVLARPIMHLYGAGFDRGTPALLLILVMAVLLAAGMVVGDFIVSTGAMWFGVLFNGIWGAALLGSAALLVPRHGATGLALSYVIAYAVQTVAQLTYVLVRLRQLRPAGDATAAPATAAAAAAAAPTASHLPGVGAMTPEPAIAYEAQ